MNTGKQEALLLTDSREKRESQKMLSTDFPLLYCHLRSYSTNLCTWFQIKRMRIPPFEHLSGRLCTKLESMQMPHSDESLIGNTTEHEIS